MSFPIHNTSSTIILLKINTSSIPITIGSRQDLPALIKRMTPTGMQRHEIMLIIVVLIALTVICRRRLRLHSGGKFALLPQLLAEKVEADGNRDHGCGETSEQCACPLNAKIVKHLTGEEGKAGSDDGAQEGVCCDGRRSAGRVSSAGGRAQGGTYNMR